MILERQMGAVTNHSSAFEFEVWISRRVGTYGAELRGGVAWLVLVWRGRGRGGVVECRCLAFLLVGGWAPIGQTWIERVRIDYGPYGHDGASRFVRN